MPQTINDVTPSGDTAGALYVAVEVSTKSWVVGISIPGAPNTARIHTLGAGDAAGLIARIRKAQDMTTDRILLTYEVGYEGFWLARWPGEGRFRFARSGVILRQLVPARASPAPLVPDPVRPDTAALMPALDALRSRFGPDIIRTAAAAGDHTGIPCCAHRSPCWTTRIPAFPRAGAGVFVAPAPP